MDGYIEIRVALLVYFSEWCFVSGGCTHHCILPGATFFFFFLYFALF